MYDHKETETIRNGYPSVYFTAVLTHHDGTDKSSLDFEVFRSIRPTSAHGNCSGSLCKWDVEDDGDEEE